MIHRTDSVQITYILKVAADKEILYRLFLLCANIKLRNIVIINFYFSAGFTLISDLFDFLKY